MIFQYASDLHLEMRPNREFFEKNPIEAVGEVLILAGDIGYMESGFYNLRFFDDVSSKFKKVFWIPGNHEFYGGTDISKVLDPFIIDIRENVHLVNNKIIDYKGIKIILTPLWSKIKPIFSYRITSQINDFKKIKFKGEILSVDNFNYIHSVSLKFLEDSIEKVKNHKSVIVSHYVPSDLCNPTEFKGSDLSDAFIVELYSLIHFSEANFWIYGHSHRNLEPTQVGDTLLLSNQFGYLPYGENRNFNRRANFKI